jgi:glycosyltransferase 2 family protein
LRSSDESRQSRRRTLGFLAKAALSAALLYFCLRSVDFHSLAQRLDHLEFVWVILALGALAFQVVLAAARWQQIVIKCGAPLSFKVAVYYMMVAAFFNQTLPSTVGGDAMRIYCLGRNGAGWRIASYSVLIDRGVGMFFLALIVAACLPWSLSLIKNPLGQAAIIAIGLGGTIAGLAVLTLALTPGSLISRFWLARHLAGIAQTSLRLCLSLLTALKIATLSVGIHLLTVAAAWSAAKAVAAPLSLVDAMLLVPPVMLIATIPISIAGWGVREGAMVVAFGYAGLPRSDGLIVSLTIGIASFIIGAAGAAWWVLSGHSLSSAPAEAAEASADVEATEASSWTSGGGNSIV